MTEQKESKLITLTAKQGAELAHLKNLLKDYTHSYRDETKELDIETIAKLYLEDAKEIKKYIAKTSLPRESYIKYIKEAMIKNCQGKTEYEKNYGWKRSALQNSKKALILAEVFEID